VLAFAADAAIGIGLVVVAYGVDLLVVWRDRRRLVAISREV
jgi:hypothetical protein